MIRTSIFDDDLDEGNDLFAGCSSSASDPACSLPSTEMPLMTTSTIKIEGPLFSGYVGSIAADRHPSTAEATTPTDDEIGETSLHGWSSDVVKPKDQETKEHEDNENDPDEENDEEEEEEEEEEEDEKNRKKTQERSKSSISSRVTTGKLLATVANSPATPITAVATRPAAVLPITTKPAVLTTPTEMLPAKHRTAKTSTTTSTGKGAALTDSQLSGIIVVGSTRSATSTAPSDITRTQDVEIYLKPARKNSKKYANFLPDKIYCHPYKYDVLVLAKMDLAQSCTVKIEACDADTLLPVVPKTRQQHMHKSAQETPQQAPPAEQQEKQEKRSISVERTRIARSLDSKTCEINCRIRFNVCSFHFGKKPFVMCVSIQAASNSSSDVELFKHFTEQFITLARKSDKENDIWELISKGTLSVTNSVIDKSSVSGNDIRVRHAPQIIMRHRVSANLVTPAAAVEKPLSGTSQQAIVRAEPAKPAPRTRQQQQQQQQRQRKQPRQSRRRPIQTVRPHKRQRLGMSDTEEHAKLSHSEPARDSTHITPDDDDDDDDDRAADDEGSDDTSPSDIPNIDPSVAPITTTLDALVTQDDIATAVPPAQVLMPAPTQAMTSAAFQTLSALSNLRVQHFPLSPLNVAPRTEALVPLPSNVSSTTNIPPMRWATGRCSLEAMTSPSLVSDPNLYQFFCSPGYFGGPGGDGEHDLDFSLSYISRSPKADSLSDEVGTDYFKYFA